MAKDQLLARIFEKISQSGETVESDIPTNLFMVKSGSDKLIVKRFGRVSYNKNLSAMGRSYSCLPYYSQITFTPATTGQSVLVASVYYRDKDERESFNDLNLTQLGLLVRTKNGVFANPPNVDGNYVIDESQLMALLNNAEEIDRVLFGRNGFGYAPYDSFEQGQQDSETFAKGGLARLLEGSKGNGVGIRRILSNNFYKLGVDVCDFDPVEQPILRVANLSSGWFSLGRLVIRGNSTSDDYYGGFAFGVLKETSQAGSQKS